MMRERKKELVQRPQGHSAGLPKIPKEGDVRGEG